MKYITMKQKNTIVRNYIVRLAAELKKGQIKLESNKILELTAKYLDSNKDIIDIKEELDALMIKIKKSIEKISIPKYVEETPKEKNNTNHPIFNYHTHTYRCGHAEYTNDEEYVKNAIKIGIKRLGFSEHSPSSDYENIEPTIRMPFNSKSEYIKSINDLKEKYKQDIEITNAFEAEYDNGKESYLRELREKTDYLILGQHFIRNVSPENNPEYPIEYAKTVELAIESGLFDIVAHPDIYMMHRKTISKNKLSLFDRNAKEAAMLICLKAKEFDIPIEINLGQIELGLQNDDEYLYPHSMFWKIAEMTGVKVLYAIDAHSPDKILKTDKSIKLINQKINIEKLNFVDSKYDPKKARKENKKLQDAYDKSLKKDITYEQYFVDYTLSTLMNDIKDKDFNPSTLVGSLRNKVQKNQKNANEKIQEYIQKEETKIKESKTAEERMIHVERLGKLKSQQDIVKSNRINLANNIYASLTEAIYLGAGTKEEIIKKTKKIIEKNKKKVKEVPIEKEEVVFTKEEKIDLINEKVEEKETTKINGTILMRAISIFLLLAALIVYAITFYVINIE